MVKEKIFEYHKLLLLLPRNKPQYTSRAPQWIWRYVLELGSWLLRLELSMKSFQIYIFQRNLSKFLKAVGQPPPKPKRLSKNCLPSIRSLAPAKAGQSQGMCLMVSPSFRNFVSTNCWVTASCNLVLYNPMPLWRSGLIIGEPDRSWPGIDDLAFWSQIIPLLTFVNPIIHLYVLILQG